MSATTRSNALAVMDVIACVKKQPMTIPELEAVTGVHRQTLHRYMLAAEGEGLVKPQGGHRPKRGRLAVTWVWQP